jgi:hypothetical protein
MFLLFEARSVLRMLSASSEPVRQFFYTMPAAAHRDSFSQDSLPVCLGNGNPNRLVTLWDIVNYFDALQFGLFINELGKWHAAALIDRDEGRQCSTVTEGALGTVRNLRIFCEAIAFEQCYQLTVFSEKHLLDAPSVGVVANEMTHLKESLIGETSSRRFLYVRNDRSGLLDQKSLFGLKVYRAFPSARKDIREAGNCLGAENNTAAVFHLMRVAEYGLRALARDRRITLSKKGVLELATWEQIIRQIEEAEVAIQGCPKTLAREAQFEFYHGAMMEFKRFKNKFRNRIMHTREEEYDRDEALSAFNHVRDFMRILASRISELQRTPLVWRGKKWTTGMDSSRSVR